MNVSKMASRRTRLSFKEKQEICELSLQSDSDLLPELDIITLQDKLNPTTSNQSRTTSFFENK